MTLGMLGGLYLKPDNPDKSAKGILGVHVASGDIRKALLIYGNFDEYHMYFPFQNMEMAEKAIEKIVLTSHEGNRIREKKIRCFDIYNSLIQIQNAKYSVLHNPGGPFLESLLHLRNQLTFQNFPVTGTVYSTSYQESLANYLCYILMSSPRIYDSLICPSQASAQAMENIIYRIIDQAKNKFHIRELTLPRLDIIPYGVDVDLYQPRDKHYSRMQVGLPTDGSIILWMGRLSASTKADLYPLLRSFKMALADVTSKAFLVIAGSDIDNYGELILRFASDIGLAKNIILMQDVSKIAKNLLYTSADIFITPSDNIQESLGLTILEAMASGLPVIASDWNGYKEIVVDSKTGFRIPTYWAQCDSKFCQFAPTTNFYGFELDHLYLAQSVCVDIEIMAKRIAILINNKDLAIKMGSDARQHALQNYDWKVVIRAYENLWKELQTISQQTSSTKHDCILCPGYFHDFMHYPTKILSDSSCFQITPYGTDILDEKSICPVYDEMRSILSFDLMHEILQKAIVPITFGCISGMLSQKYNIPMEDVTYHVMWMLKNNLLKL